MISQRLNRQLEMTRRITNEETVEINQVLSKLENVYSTIDQLVDDVNEVKWNNPAIIDPLMPYYALLAYQENDLSEENFATLLMWWSASQQHQQILKAVTPKDKEFKELLKQTLLSILPRNQQDLLKNTRYPLTLQADYSSQLSPEQVDSFFSAINKLPKSQQVFFVVTEKIHLLKALAQASVRDRLAIFNFNALGRTQAISKIAQLFSTANASQFLNNQTIFGPPRIICGPIEIKTLIPSIGLMQAYLNTKFGAQAMLLNPVIGLSTEQDTINSCMNMMRDMAIHFPKVKLPTLADGLLAEWFDFTLHDFYHAFAASAIPDQHKKLFINIYLIAKSCLFHSKEYAINKSAFDLKLSALIDMEHSNYRSLFSLLATDKKEKPETIFLLTLTTWLNKKTFQLLPVSTKQKLFETIAQFVSAQAPDIADTIPGYLASIERNFKSDVDMASTAKKFYETWNKLYKYSPTFFVHTNQTEGERLLTAHSQRLNH